MKRLFLAVIIPVSAAMALIGQTIPNKLKNGSPATPQETMDRNMANAKTVTERQEKEKAEKAQKRDTPDVHAGRLQVNKNVSLGGAVGKGEVSGNVKVSAPPPKSAPPEAPAAKASPAPAAPAAPAPAKAPATRERDMIDHSRPAIEHSGGGPTEKGAVERAGAKT